MFITPLMLVATKGHTYLKQTRASQLKVCLSMYDPFLLPGVKGLKDAPEIFKE